MRWIKLGEWRPETKILAAWGRLVALPVQTRLAVLLIVIAGAVLEAQLSAAQALPQSFHDLSRVMASRATAFVLAFVCLGVAAGLLAREENSAAHATERWSWSRLSRGLVHGGAALFAAITLIGGVKAVERFSIAEGPQVMFIGSGTVHRFLFGDAEGARQIDLGIALGDHGVKFWAFEGTSSDGLRTAAYVYDHRSSSSFEERVPVIGMASADVVRELDGEVLWAECANDTCGERYFHAIMQPANPAANTFGVVPVAIDVRPHWYITGCDALKVAPRLGYVDGEPHVFVPRGVECHPVTLYATHEQGGTAMSIEYLETAHIDRASPVCAGEPAAMNGELCGIRVSQHRNFSLDLSHVVDRPGASIALGNWALQFVPGKWRTIQCDTCRPRDLVLIVPIRHETGWRPLPSVCAALKYLGPKVDTKIDRFVDFDDCGAAVPPERCRCKLTAAGQRLRLQLRNELPRQRTSQRIDGSH